MYEPRKFYASINIYNEIEAFEYVMDRTNIVGSTTSWDIDSLDDDCRKVISMARKIVDVLDGFGISKSMIIKWSGRGARIHINSGAFSPKLYSKIQAILLASDCINRI